MEGGTDTKPRCFEIECEGGTDTVRASNVIRSLKYQGETDRSVILIVNDDAQLVEIDVEQLERDPVLYHGVNQSVISGDWVTISL